VKHAALTLGQSVALGVQLKTLSIFRVQQHTD